MRITAAERLLQDLGVTEPFEIDLEAIAYHVGASVRYRPLQGCEARIIGNKENAIITVRSDSHPRRKRFSIAHELGHWHHHRGRCLVCRIEEGKPGGPLSPEKIADGFAADLLMPHYVFKEHARKITKLTLKSIAELSDAFGTSFTATAIRLVENDFAPVMVVCHGQAGRKWFVRAPSVPSRWFPQDTLDAESFAFDVLYGNKTEDAAPRKIGADAWFDRHDAGRFEIYEQTRRVSDGVLTILHIENSKMLEEDSR